MTNGQVASLEIEMNRQLWFLAVLGALLMPSVSSAQELERTKNWEVGDKATWNYVYGGRSVRLVEEVVEVTDAEIRSTLRFGGRTYEQTLSTRDLSTLKGICFETGQTCEFSPREVWVDFPLEKGKRWSDRVTETGETFIVETTYQYNVEGVEKVNTPAGEFEAYRVSGSARISRSGVLRTGNFTYWLAAINGKLVRVKDEYTNTFGPFFTRELVSAELK